MDTVMATWSEPTLIHNKEPFQDAGKDARLILPGRFGSQYARLVVLSDGNWLVVYTIYDNNGYTKDPMGGTKLQFAKSCDEGKSWTVISTIAHPSRDLDNGQMILAQNGDVLMACRSVRWQESYQLPIYKSADGGRTWEFYSMLDEQNGPPGSMGNPDKGMYEPHFYRLADGRLSVMYANEVHVTQRPHYSQIISQRISQDDGRTWGEEIWVAHDCAAPQLRPGMPVWVRMKDGRFIVVYEVVNLVLSQCESATIYYKISPDGLHWEPGIGTPIDNQWGGPYIESLPDGKLVVTSLSGQVSVSDDLGQNWRMVEPLPFPSHVWPALYAQGNHKFALLNAVRRECGGENIQIAFGELKH